MGAAASYSLRFWLIITLYSGPTCTHSCMPGNTVLILLIIGTFLLSPPKMLIFYGFKSLPRIVNSIGVQVFLFFACTVFVIFLFFLSFRVTIRLSGKLIRFDESKKFCHQLFCSFSNYMIWSVETNRILVQHLDISFQTLFSSIVTIFQSL